LSEKSFSDRHDVDPDMHQTLIYSQSTYIITIPSYSGLTRVF
ncbi:hypothetical protein HMPREF9370_2182, partial [Neisseria wadsworthii 9715]